MIIYVFMFERDFEQKINNLEFIWH